MPLKSLNPYSRAASAAMTTLHDFDISCGSEYNEAIARPENLAVSALSSILTPLGIFARTDLALSVAVGPGQIDTTATLYGLKSSAISNVSEYLSKTESTVISCGINALLNGRWGL